MISIQEVKLVNDIWYKLDFPGGMLGNESNTDLTSRGHLKTFHVEMMLMLNFIFICFQE